MNDLHTSLARGYSCLSAWADLLDRINVFPVADGDTGTNLRISLAPFRVSEQINTDTPKLLTRCATGNSGNIAAAFFCEFCQAKDVGELAEKAKLGRDNAWAAIANPREGTMLSVFDSLVSGLHYDGEPKYLYDIMSPALQSSVQESSELLPDLREAGVVDSGALAIYLFFDAFFYHLTEQSGKAPDIYSIFSGKLAINTSFEKDFESGYCVDVLLEVDQNEEKVKEGLAGLGESVVVVKDDSQLKVHIHTPDPEQLRGQLGQYGEIVQWKDEELKQDTQKPSDNNSLHLITDAAGSMTKEIALQHGISLLDSYIIIGEHSRPESLYGPEQIYPLMRKGQRITTAQASNYERHQYYESLTSQFGKCLYLSVGSAFTGNYDIAMAWKKESDPDDLLTVLDTGAASGRLALIALLTARHKQQITEPEEVIAFARSCLSECLEYVFIDELKYLVAGGRVSKASGFFGDLLKMKPIVSPNSKGVEKVGVVRSRKKQLTFALDRLRECYNDDASPLILLQYTDNKEWVNTTVKKALESQLANAEILLIPLSLTSGVHMGPGTWSVAFAETERETSNRVTAKLRN